jgi:hypothetical protein
VQSFRGIPRAKFRPCSIIFVPALAVVQFLGSVVASVYIDVDVVDDDDVGVGVDVDGCALFVHYVTIERDAGHSLTCDDASP